MTSVDSGVETGNDSNDSSVAHENNVIAAAAAGSNLTNNGNQELVGPQKPLGLPVASICPGLTNNADGQSTSVPSTSGPLVLHANAEPTKVTRPRDQPNPHSFGPECPTCIRTECMYSPFRANDAEA